MFEQTLTLLLAGEFICAVRYPDAWRFLADEASRRDAEAFLGKLGRHLAQTRQGGAWFAAYCQVGMEERRAIRDGFADIKHNLRLLVGFFVHVMQAQRQDQFLAPGSVIEANRLMAAIDENPNLRGQLLALAGLGKGATGDGTHRGTLERLLKRLRDDRDRSRARTRRPARAGSRNCAATAPWCRSPRTASALRPGSPGTSTRCCRRSNSLPPWAATSQTWRPACPP